MFGAITIGRLCARQAPRLLAAALALIFLAAPAHAETVASGAAKPVSGHVLGGVTAIVLFLTLIAGVLAVGAVLIWLLIRVATRLLIAHRLSAVRDADRIVVLDGGRVVQEGTFPQLAGTPGLFAQLLARQT